MLLASSCGSGAASSAHPAQDESPAAQGAETRPALPPSAPTGASDSESGNLKLVALTDLDPTIIVADPLATDENPFHFRFYKKDPGYLRRGTARKVVEVQEALRAKGLGLKIWAAYRPFAVQVKMFELAGGNANWISDPYRETGKKTHVRAVAVDCTLVDGNGMELEMPTPYLDFENGAARMKQSYTKLPKRVLANRKLLRDVMEDHGMEIYAGEWWHFEDADWEDYPVIQPSDLPQIHREMLQDDLARILNSAPQAGR